MRVVPLAADSLGVRSMATYVEAGEVRLLLDPGASLSPRRYGLDPAPEEVAALERALAQIEVHARRATLITVSHYHADHAVPTAAWYAGRAVWAKHPRRMLDPAQGLRARSFWRALQGHAPLQVAEGREADFGGVRVKVSPPLPHGREDSGFGFVVAVTVEAERRFVHAADVQGPISAVATAYLLRERPDLLYLSGPPTYLEARLGAELVAAAFANLRRIVNEIGCQIIVDHHALRDRRARERLGPIFETGRVVTAAEYLGQPDACLEAFRPQLWARHRARGGPGGRPPLARPGGARAGKEAPWPS